MKPVRGSGQSLSAASKIAVGLGTRLWLLPVRPRSGNSQALAPRARVDACDGP
jgi:hypothetical protein